MSTRLDQVGENILKGIRHEGFKLLRQGVEAVTNSFNAWSERNIL